jgi:hypothetical protein
MQSNYILMKKIACACRLSPHHARTLNGWFPKMNLKKHCIDLQKSICYDCVGLSIEIIRQLSVFFPPTKIVSLLFHVALIFHEE